MKYMNRIFLFVILISSTLLSQTSQSRLTIVGDSLKGKVIDGKNIREVYGNVVITQEDVVITCNKAIQYITVNIVELIGDVVIVQDSIIIKTEHGRYYGDTRIAISDTTVNLINGKLNLVANKGNYNLNSKVANFSGNVTFNDSLTSLSSIKLTYTKDKEEIIAVGNVVVTDTISVVKADSLIHYRNIKFSEGFGNIVVENLDNNLKIFGEHLLDNKQSKVSKISGEPFLVQIEKLSDGSYDTLFIKSKVMEASSDSSSKLVAIDSVRIIRGSFLSINDYTIYDRAGGQITIFKQEEKKTPILWYGNNQVVGDSIYINLDSSKIKSVEVIRDAILISEDSTYEFRYNQMSGDSIYLFLLNNKLKQTKVNGNVLSIYYLYEENEPNGLLKSSAKVIKINFENSRVTDVKMYGSPISEYHPENLVLNNEKSFTLPTFYIYKDKPSKTEFNFKYLKYNLN